VRDYQVALEAALICDETGNSDESSEVSKPQKSWCAFFAALPGERLRWQSQNSFARFAD